MSKINRGMNLPETNHVMRHVPWSKLHKDANDNVIGFLPEAFRLRENEDGLSVNWIEYFEGAHEEKVARTVNAIRSIKNIGPKSAFGISSVLAIKQTCKNTAKLIKVVYWPSPDNVTHSLIRHIPADDIELLDALSTEAFSTLILNSDIAP